MKKIVKLSLIVLWGVCLAACTPFIDSRREAGQVQPVGQSRPDRIAICYFPFWTSEDTLLEMATTACAERGKKANFDDKSYFNCRLLAPNTAFYRCK